MKQRVLTAVVLCVMLWSGVAFAQTGNGMAMLENPAPDSYQSGVSVISGWACDAENIVIEIDGVPFLAAYGTVREDTQEMCGDTDNGFSFLWNWSNSGGGEHTVRALSDGVEFGTATVTVTTFGTTFLRDAQGSHIHILDDFPTTGEETRIQWTESLQNFVIRDNPAAFTKNFVQAALDRYDRDGREATLAYYNDRASIYDNGAFTAGVYGQWYMFIINENDLFVVHPVMPELIGRNVKTIVGSDGYELGKEIATATEVGHWIHYLWPNPVACDGAEEPKRSWAVRHDGLIFVSGYYKPMTNYCRSIAVTAHATRCACSVDTWCSPWESYSHVSCIAAVLENPTPQSFRSGISAISGWACDAEEIVIEINGKPFPAAYGTIREDTAAVCGDTDNGFSLLWNWNNLGDGVHTVLALIDGVPFARSRVTVTTFGDEMLGDEEKATFTRDFVQATLDRYDREGREATLAYHNGSASIDREWYVFIIDENDLIVAHPFRPELIGQDIKTLVDSNGYEFGKEIATATTDGGRIEFLHTLVPGSKYGVPGRDVDSRSQGSYGLEAGHWIHYRWPNPAAGGEKEPKHSWVIRHDGLIFGSGYYGPPNFQEYYLLDFPTEDLGISLQWSQSLQNFVITGLLKAVGVHAGDGICLSAGSICPSVGGICLCN